MVLYHHWHQLTAVYSHTTHIQCINN